MKEHSYVLGQTIEIFAQFLNKELGNPADPTTVTAGIATPDDVVALHVYLVDPGVVRDDVGKYHFRYRIIHTGIHSYTWVGDGTVATADEGVFLVPGSKFG